MKDMEKNPHKYMMREEPKKKKSGRTRSKVERPKQKYLYASQRKAIELMKKKGGGGKTPQKNEPVDPSALTDENELFEETEVTVTREQQMSLLQQEMQQKQMDLARSFGLSNPSTQTADALIGTSCEETPRIANSIRLDEEDDETITSNSFAYVIYKPVGWSILGGEKKKRVAAAAAAVNKPSNKSTAVADSMEDDPYAPIPPAPASGNCGSIVSIAMILRLERNLI